MYRKSVRPRMGPRGTPPLTQYSILLKSFHPEPLSGVYYGGKTKYSKAKCLTWNPVSLKFMKKTSMTKSVKRLENIKCYWSSNPDLVSKNCHQFYQVQLSEDLQLIEKTRNHTGNQKKSTFLEAINQPII